MPSGSTTMNTSDPSSMRIDCDFPGGNLKVIDLQGDVVFVRPDLRDTTTSWFYWAFRLTHANGRRLTFRFLSDHPVGTRGPAISTDGRKTWRWTTEPFSQDDFAITIPVDATEAYVAFAPLYTQMEWEQFAADLPQGAPWELGTIATSRKGRPVELLHVGAPAAEAAYHLVVTARHHCCEMIANFVMEGIIRTILDADTEEGALLRDRASVSFIPFIDKDGAEDGDQGKNRAPWDHNRDYSPDRPHQYPETLANARLVETLAKRYGLDLFLDLHCPWIRGNYNEVVYQVGSSTPEHAAQQNPFGEIVESLLEPGALPYHAKDNLPFGTAWNTGANGTAGRSSTKFAAATPGVRFTTSFEIPYADASDVDVTPANARLLGRAIARAIAHYLSRNSGK